MLLSWVTVFWLVTNCLRAVKRINEHFTDEEHAALFAVKGARTWREAILEEFDVEVGAEVVEA